MAYKSRTNIRLEEAIAAYELRIKNEGQAERSRYTAHYALERFRKAVATKRDPNPFLHTITAAMADDYCYGENGIRPGISAVTFNRYRSVLKVFFDHALRMRWVDVNPFEGIAPARPDAPKSRLMLNASELLGLLDHCESPVERIACSLGMNTGLRANDIRHLTVFDASLAGGEIQTMIRKTNKFDVKPITMELAVELKRWLDEYARIVGLSDRGELQNDWLLVPTLRMPAPNEREQWQHPFLDKDGKPILNRPHTHPWRLVQRPLARMGYPIVGEGFHTLRRSSARSLFEALRRSGEGRDHALMVVKDFLNHASVTQTEHYLGLNQERTIRDSLLKDQPFLSKLANSEQERASDHVPRLIIPERSA